MTFFNGDAKVESQLLTASDTGLKTFSQKKKEAPNVNYPLGISAMVKCVPKAHVLKLHLQRSRAERWGLQGAIRSQGCAATQGSTSSQEWTCLKTRLGPLWLSLSM